RTASKLTDSVRRARDGRGTEQGEAAAESPAETAGEAPEPPPAATPTGGSRSNAQQEPPLPRIPSRRVWPD
ncbi:MAG: hypothetical protein ABEJ96_02925, partial [Thiohalorhabdaceae bacterium]